MFASASSEPHPRAADELAVHGRAQAPLLDRRKLADYISPIKMARPPAQLSLPTPRTWGGRRRGAGRKPTPGRRPSVPHRTRSAHAASHPVHVTFRAVDVLRCLRARRVFPAVQRALGVPSRVDFRVVEYSVQQDHIHFIVEADNARALASGIRGVAVRVARAVNRAVGRRGRVWDSRYHARALKTPRAVRHTLVYVLMNFRKHRVVGTGIDPCSSAPWFAGWRSPPETVVIGPRPCARPQTWLARVGWRRHGLIDLTEQPKGRPH